MNTPLKNPIKKTGLPKKAFLLCALILTLTLAGICAWNLMSSGLAVTVNGREVEGPFKVLAGGWWMAVSIGVLLLAALLIAFVFAGVAFLSLGVFALTGLILLAIALPFLSPIVVPLLVVMIACLWTLQIKNPATEGSKQ